MEQEIASHKEAIAQICRSMSVESLLAFGSAPRAPSFAAADSLVFLVQFKPLPSAQYASSYFSLAAELEALLRTPVELVELEAADNPYFKKAVLESRTVQELSPS
jgi:predicted nucleotidyltransferase